MSRRFERLHWRDNIGVIQRDLQLAKRCPRCSCTLAIRLDWEHSCKHPVCVPVICIRCTHWFALPRHCLPGGRQSWSERAWQWLEQTLWGKG